MIANFVFTCSSDMSNQELLLLHCSAKLIQKNYIKNIHSLQIKFILTGICYVLEFRFLQNHMQLQIWSGNKISSNVLTISRIWAFALASFSSSISLTSSSVIPLKSSTSSSAPILTVWKYTYNHHVRVFPYSDIIHVAMCRLLFLKEMDCKCI